MVSKLLISLIKNALKEIETRYRVKYGVAFFDVKIKATKNSIVLEGKVLSDRQKNEVN